jgi:DNA-binding SARP family transcriptional activator
VSEFHLELLGGFSCRRTGGEACILPTRKTEALLAYLALPAGRFHAREKLTALLWGEMPEERARQNFRQTLARLRRGLGGGALKVERDGLALDSRAVTVDVGEFEAGAAAATGSTLDRALALYKGDLLEGFNVDEEPFEEWRVVERERLREMALEGLARLLAEHLHAERAEPAIRAAQRILALDPLQEVVHRALMSLLWRHGRRAAALQQYQSCLGRLQRELGAEPEEKTRELYRQILRAPALSPAAAGEPRRNGVSPPAVGPSAEGSAGVQLVGRAPQLDRLGAALGRALDAGTHVAIVVGEAGIGKTRLLQEFAGVARDKGLRVLRAWCHATEQPLPFRPWVDALRDEERALPGRAGARISPGARAQLARVFPELSDAADSPPAAGEQGPLFDAFAELMRDMASDEPLMIVLEDLHWADAMSASLLAFLGRRLNGRPVLVVGSARPEELADVPVLRQAIAELRAAGSLTELVLDPLSREETHALARALHGERDLGHDVSPDLWRLSEGNPFVIVEIARALSGVPPGAPPTLPSTVRESIAQRFGRLSESSREMLALAAVIGRSFRFRLLHRASGRDEAEVARAVEELVRRRILEAVGERLDFCHDRLRQVAYDDLLEPRRVLFHRAVGLAIESAAAERLDDVADRLGHHFLRAGAAPKAFQYLVRFADVAARRYAHDEALDGLRLAAGVVDDLPLPDRDRSRLDLALRQGFILANLGRQRECLELMEAHAALQRRVLDRALASDYYFRVGMTYAYLGDTARARMAGDAALREAQAAGDDERAGKALYALAAGCHAAGTSREAIAHDLRAIPLLGGPHAQHWLGLVYWNLAMSQVLVGELGSALESVGRCLSVAGALGDSKLQSLTWYLESLVHAARGDIDRAIERARAAADGSRDTVTTMLALVASGYAFAQGADPTRGIVLLERALAHLERAPVQLTYGRTLGHLAAARLAAGDLPGATADATRALELTGADGPSYNAGIAQRVLGAVALATGDPAAAEAHLTAALASFEACDASFEAGMTRLDLARALACRRALGHAREQLAAAALAFEAAGAPRRVAEARGLGSLLGIDVP